MAGQDDASGSLRFLTSEGGFIPIGTAARRATPSPPWFGVVPENVLKHVCAPKKDSKTRNGKGTETVGGRSRTRVDFGNCAVTRR